MLAAKLLIVAAVAGAQPSAGGLDITLSTREAHPGETVTVSGAGCRPDSEVSISLDGSDFAKTSADSDGTYRAPVMIPDDIEPGDYLITATGIECGSSADITVLATGTGDNDSSWRVVAAISIWLAGIALAGAVVIGVLRWDTVRSRQADDR